MSCGKFLFASPYLPAPTLDVPSPAVNSSSRLPICQFPPWMSHLLLFPTCQFRLPVPILDVPPPHLGCPISCGKFLFPSPYLPVPTLDVPSPVVKFLFPSPYLAVPTSCGTCFLPTCQIRPWKSHYGLGSPMSCGKFLFASPYLPAPTLDVPSPAVNSSSRLPICQFPPWMSHLLLFPTCQFRLPVPILDVPPPHLGCPISCGKFLFPSPYLPVPILDVPSPVVNSSSHLPTWQFRPWMSHLLR